MLVGVSHLQLLTVTPVMTISSKRQACPTVFPFKAQRVLYSLRRRRGRGRQYKLAESGSGHNEAWPISNPMAHRLLLSYKCVFQHILLDRLSVELLLPVHLNGIASYRYCRRSVQNTIAALSSFFWDLEGFFSTSYHKINTKCNFILSSCSIFP